MYKNRENKCTCVIYTKTWTDLKCTNSADHCRTYLRTVLIWINLFLVLMDTKLYHKIHFHSNHSLFTRTFCEPNLLFISFLVSSKRLRYGSGNKWWMLCFLSSRYCFGINVINLADLHIYEY